MDITIFVLFLFLFQLFENLLMFTSSFGQICELVADGLYLFVHVVGGGGFAFCLSDHYLQVFYLLFVLFYVLSDGDEFSSHLLYVLCCYLQFSLLQTYLFIELFHIANQLLFTIVQILRTMFVALFVLFNSGFVLESSPLWCASHHQAVHFVDDVSSPIFVFADDSSPLALVFH
jgi:hypothetical protein